MIDVEVIGIEAVEPDAVEATAHPPTAVELEELCASFAHDYGIEVECRVIRARAISTPRWA